MNDPTRYDIARKQAVAAIEGTLAKNQYVPGSLKGTRL
jgi:hypothetical protein